MIKISILKKHSYNGSVFEDLEGQEFENLKNDIKERGLQIPVDITSDNIILCGHQRIKALKQLGFTELQDKDYRIRKDLDTDYKQKIHLISDNIRRRQLDDIEKVRVGEELEKIERIEAKKRMSMGKEKLPYPEDIGQTRDKVAGKLGWSGKTYETKKEIIRLADEDEIKKIHQTKKIPKSLKQKYTKSKQEKRKNKINDLVIKSKSVVTILEGDCFDKINEILDNSIDLFVTDPSYNRNKAYWDSFEEEEFFKFTKSWLLAIKPKLKKEYNLFICFSPFYWARLEYLLKELGFDIKSRIIWHYRNMGGRAKSNFAFNNSYDIILHCGNRELNFSEKWSDERFDVWTMAIPQSNFVIDTKEHPTQKPIELLRRIIKYASYEGDNVLDIFAGSGVTGLVSKEMNRNCWLIEKDKSYIKIINDKLGETNGKN